MKAYITTPLYYVNAPPHIGHTYTTVAADSLARFYRMAGYDVFFLTGTDEHGQKIDDAAKSNNTTPQELADKNAGIYKALWDDLNISYTRFIRTTEEDHKRVVRDVFEKLAAKGDIFKGEYSGCYCVHCESYVQPEDQNNPLCPDCERPANNLTEPSYFFKLSAYRDKLQKFIEDDNFVMPSFRKDEVLNVVKDGLNDICVTRKNVKWGIGSPTPEEYTIYVWFDALLNYLSGIGYLHDDETFSKYWPPDIQIIGKDIMRFHHIIWPGILMALDLDLPHKIFAHGWWVVGKDKISKSRGNIVPPAQIIEKCGVDAFRYFMLREVPFGLDGEYSEETYKKRYNSDLVNDLGNLVNRTLTLVEKLFDSKIPEGRLESVQVKLMEDIFDKYTAGMEELAFSEAIEAVWSMVSHLNKYLDTQAPWRTEKDQSGQTLYNVMSGIRDCVILLTPFIPSSACKIWNMIGLEGDPAEKSFAELKEALPGGITINEKKILFPRTK